MNNDPIIAVNEIFGPTLQGEGRSIGTPTMFLRLAGCNLACSWCDTRYAWDWRTYSAKDEIHPMTASRIMDTLLQMGGDIRHLVISGGEPMLQQKALGTLIYMLGDHGWFTEVETAGTKAPMILADQFNVSPKLANSLNPLKKRYKVEALEALRDTGKANFKFVVKEVGDFLEIDQMVQALHLSPVYIMPEGTNAEVLEHRTHQIVNAIIERGYHYSPRLHIQLYGKQRGI